MSYAVVEFQTSERKYDYEIPKHLEGFIEPGSYVIVDSPYTHYTVVVVRDVKSTSKTCPENRQPVIDLVDDSQYLENKSKEEKRAELMTELESRGRNMAAMQRFEMLASTDDTARVLLEQLKELDA